MLRKFLALAALAISAMTPALAQDPWLHIYYPDGSSYQGFDMNDILDITFDESAGTMIINGIDGSSTAFAKNIDRFEINPNVAAIYIQTDNEYLTEITSKTIYEEATMTFIGRGLQPDYVERVKIRGRGNSTWGYSKKPYRLKFSEKQRLLLPKKAKNYALLANYIDGAMMRNFAAFKFGQIIDMPWINHCEPVDVYFNDIYKGSYMITEKVGFNNGSVNLKASDEPNSIMLELDTNSPAADDIYFESGYYDSDNGYYFPVTVKDPDAPEDPTEAQIWLNSWISDFDRFMDVVASGNETKIFEACDLESLVRYIMVFNLCCNQEIDHPKSVFLYKTRGGKWFFGPCWDFDWAFGYSPTYSKGTGGNPWYPVYYPSYENPLLGLTTGYNANGSVDGHAGVFFYKLCKTAAFQKRFKELWDDFYANHLDEFWAEFDAYAERLRPSANLQGLTRSQYRGFDKNVDELREWISNRIEYINSDANHGLWESNTFSKF